MDKATFELVGPGEKTTVSHLPHLTTDKRALFDLLKQDNWRIGQERLEGEWVARALGDIIVTA